MAKGLVGAVWLGLSGAAMWSFQAEPAGPPLVEQLRPDAGLTEARPRQNLYALLINGDGEDRHVDNIKAYRRHLIDVFKVPEGNITILCGACSPEYAGATRDSIRSTLYDLSMTLTPADSLFVYTTGHGERSAGQSVLNLEDEQTFTDEEFAIKALAVSAGRIHYYGDQCYGGGFAQAMVANRLGQEVIAFSAATPEAKCACQHFTPALLKGYADGLTERQAFDAAGRNAKDVDASLPPGLYLAPPGRAWTDALVRRGIVEDVPLEEPEYFRPAPELVGARIGGQRQVRLSDYRGSVVLVDFWASWCPPCRRELPELAKLRESLKRQKFEIIGVTVDDDAKDVRRLMRKNKTRYPVLALKDDPKGYKVDYLPTAYLVDCAGRITKTYEGYKEPAELEADVREAIRECNPNPPASPKIRAPIAALPK